MSKETIEMGDLEKPAESATKHVEGVGESGAVELFGWNFSTAISCCERRLKISGIFSTGKFPACTNQLLHGFFRTISSN
jgi:hypothetical protein